MLEFKNLSVTKGSWKGAFSGQFAQDRFHAICGESGSGKSTLFSLMTGLQLPENGRLTLDGKDLTAIPPHKRGLSYMSQDNSLFPAVSCEGNLKLAYKGTDDSFSISAKELLDTLNLEHHLLSRYPHELSGGQIARMNLARALISGHKWILLDEPFASVDRPSRLSILSKLRLWRERAGTSILLISHDLDDMFPVATDVTICHSGRIVEQSSLSTAQLNPCHIATARLLKSGLILERKDGPHFLPAQGILRSDEARVQVSRNLESTTITSFISTHTGGVTKIIDLTNHSECSIASSDQFTGHLTFDPNLLVKLSV